MYSIRRWWSMPGILWDDTEQAKTAEEAIEKAKRLTGPCNNIIDDDLRERIRSMEKGEVIRRKWGDLKITLRIKRTKN